MFEKLWIVIDQFLIIGLENIIKSDYWGNLGHFCWLIFKMTLKMPRYIISFFSSNSQILNYQVEMLCRILKQDFWDAIRIKDSFVVIYSLRIWNVWKTLNCDWPILNNWSGKYYQKWLLRQFGALLLVDF